jgi:hypothetical protein
VTVGGGRNHRPNLAAMVPLKENHIAAAGGVTTAIDAVRREMARTGQKAGSNHALATLVSAVTILATTGWQPSYSLALIGGSACTAFVIGGGVRAVHGGQKVSRDLVLGSPSRS